MVDKKIKAAQAAKQQADDDDAEDPDR